MHNKELENLLNSFIKTLKVFNNNDDYKLGMKIESIASAQRNSDNKTFFYIYTNDEKQIIAKPINGKARAQSIATGLKYCLENNYTNYNELTNPDNIYGRAIIKYIIENIVNQDLSIKDKIITSLDNQDNQVLKREEVINLVLKKYPNTNKTSIIPTDYCFNLKNRGSSQYELFEYLGSATFRYLGVSNNYNKIIYPDEIAKQTLVEGAKKKTIVNSYERNPQARKICIKEYGYKCTICKFDFEKVYGEIGRDFIHVHHLKPLSEINEEYRIDPFQDLRPVCPNCHAMLHKNIPAYSIEEIQNLIRQNDL